jgi:4-hydroxy-3-polyprenylbenzoate decarboxylase
MTALLIRPGSELPARRLAASKTGKLRPHGWVERFTAPDISSPRMNLADSADALDDTRLAVYGAGKAPVRDNLAVKKYNPDMGKRIVLAITGASGAVYGIRALELLRLLSHEVHLVISDAARRTLTAETGRTPEELAALAHAAYAPDDFRAPFASGSRASDGMLVAPCSIKTLSAIAGCYDSELIPRAADVCLKEGRPLVLMVRETPLHVGQLRLMLRAAESGAVIFPPVPAFYGKPQTAADIVDASVGRALARLGVENDFYPKWDG